MKKFEVRSSKFEVGVRKLFRTSNFALRTFVFLVVFLTAQVAAACPVCFGNATDSSFTKASDNATLFLLGMVVFVQIGFGALFVSFWRRARALRKHREQFHVIHGGIR